MIFNVLQLKVKRQVQLFFFKQECLRIKIITSHAQSLPFYAVSGTGRARALERGLVAAIDLYHAMLKQKILQG